METGSFFTRARDLDTSKLPGSNAGQEGTYQWLGLKGLEGSVFVEAVKSGVEVVDMTRHIKTPLKQKPMSENAEL